MKSVTVVDNPVRGGELGRRRDVVEYSLPGYVATTDDQFFEIVAVAGHAGAVLAPPACRRILHAALMLYGATTRMSHACHASHNGLTLHTPRRREWRACPARRHSAEVRY